MRNVYPSHSTFNTWHGEEFLLADTKIESCTSTGKNSCSISIQKMLLLNLCPSYGVKTWQSDTPNWYLCPSLSSIMFVQVYSSLMILSICNVRCINFPNTTELLFLQVNTTRAIDLLTLLMQGECSPTSGLLCSPALWVPLGPTSDNCNPSRNSFNS